MCKRTYDLPLSSKLQSASQRGDWTKYGGVGVRIGLEDGMAVLFKVPPPITGIEGPLVLSAKAYESSTVTSGDRVFLWWSETHGGSGLAARGVVVGAIRKSSDWEAKVAVSSEVTRSFSKEDLRPFRDAQSGEPQATLARRLYRHSLNKVTNVDVGEENFLDTFFV
jgi:hypothetical protein